MRKKVELLINEEEFNGVEAVSLVRFPAIEEGFVFLSALDSELMTFKTDDEKRILMGPALIPDKMIPRLDEDGNEYDVFFTKETVRQAMNLFMKEARTNEHTIEHESKIDGVTIVESWIIEDQEKDKSSLYDFSLPVGTWFLSVKVHNDDVWKKVKSRQVRGFSVEGYFTDRLVEMQDDRTWLRDKEIFQQLQTIILNETDPVAFFDNEPLFARRRDAELWGEIFNQNTKTTTHKLNGQTLFMSKINK